MKPADFEGKLGEAREALLDEVFPVALKLYEKLTRHRPRASRIWFEYGCAAAGLREIGLAERAWGKARELSPENPELLLDLGHQYQCVRQTGKARLCFKQAASINPLGINPRISLAVDLEQHHLFDEARAWVEECLTIDRQDEQARYFSAVLDHRENKIEEAERRLCDLIASEPKHPYVAYACRFELAQMLDRTGRFDEAMALLTEAKKMVRGLAEIEEVARQYDRWAQMFSGYAKSLPKDILGSWAKLFPERKREAIPPLAFLGGHPRSGTTLLEQVLDTHPTVTAYDETLAMPRVALPDAPKLGGQISAARLNVMRRGYIQGLKQELDADSKGKLLLDKNPSLTAFLPLWLRVFPELRVLIALRDPRDVIISCYFQNIPLNVVNSNFLSFERLAKHYDDLMGIWLAVREWKGFTWLETHYEDMVTNLEKEGRRVTEFLGLRWREEQARFYEEGRKKRFNSPTYHDVTQPIYTRSVARWRAYEKYLAPILPALEPYCRAFGYD